MIQSLMILRIRFRVKKILAMANVSLVVAPEAASAFLAAQEEKSVRALVLVIENEAIVLKTSVASSAGARICLD
jgi:hypothetical protein